MSTEIIKAKCGRETLTRELTPAGGGSAHELVSSRVPEELPPLARAFAVLLFGAGHDGDDEKDEDAGRSADSDGARCPCSDGTSLSPR